MHIITKKSPKEAHPYIPELKEGYTTGKLTRREFIRNATLLGMSTAAAYAFTGTLQPGPAHAAGGMPKRGGVFKLAQRMQMIDHPARLSWMQAANVVRQVAEYLTDMNADNIARPWLAEKWRASEDLKTWDLHIRKGVTFNTGQPMTADDVIFTMNEWLDPDIGSSMLGLLSYWGGPQNIEKVDDYHIRLHLDSPNIGLPEHLFHYAGVILPRTFEGDFIKQPVGTGPFLLEEFADAERAVLTRRPEGYWKMGADGSPLPYIDKLMIIHMDKDAGMAAFQAGQVDSAYIMRPSAYEVFKNNKKVTAYTASSAWTFVLRMRVDIPPWDDNRVRTALKMCQDRAKMLDLAGYGLGDVGIDAHVAPAHPSYCEKPIPAYDPQSARALLEEYAKEKGIRLPLKVTLASKNDAHEPAMAQALKELARPAGFDIALDLTEPSGYWDRWTEVDLGLTVWAHRPIATMVLPLAYIKEAIGSWNETRWYDDEFTAVLRKAEATLDVDERRKHMCVLEDIFQERGPIGVSYWVKVFQYVNAQYKNAWIHPAQMLIFPRETWKEA